jgi:hypothetical protein
MKVEVAINGRISLILTPESPLEAQVLITMIESAGKKGSMGVIEGLGTDGAPARLQVSVEK